MSKEPNISASGESVSGEERPTNNERRLMEAIERARESMGNFLTPDEALVCWRALDRVPELEYVEYHPAFMSAHAKVSRWAGDVGTFKCPECGKDTPHNHDESRASHPSLAETGKPPEWAHEDFIVDRPSASEAIEDFGKWEELCSQADANDRAKHGGMDACKANKRAARSNLETLFRQQQEEIERWKLRTKIEYDNRKRTEESAEYALALASLKKEQITRKEAELILPNLYEGAGLEPDEIAAIAKLRSISISGPSDSDPK